MNEFESLEKELKSLTPHSPSSQQSNRIEKGLGDAGNLSMRRLPEEMKSGTTPESLNSPFSRGWEWESLQP